MGVYRYKKKMGKRSTLFLILAIFMISFCSIELFLQLNLNDHPESIQNRKFKQLNSSGYWNLPYIYIDDYGWNSITWDEAVLQPWCSGNGTWNDPFIIENVTIDGPGRVDALLIENSDRHFIIRNSTFLNAGSGIRFNHVDNGRLLNNTCKYNARGIRLELSGNNTISGNILNYNNHGINFYVGGNNNIIYNNTINYNTASGIWINSAGNLCNITKNKLIGNGGYTGVVGHSGIEVAYTDGIKIINNLIVNSSDEGIEFFESDNNDIINNTIQGSGSHGIFLDGGESQFISNNTIIESRNNGIRLIGRSPHTIFNNSISKSGSNGIHLSGGNSHIILNNSISESGDNGIHLSENNNNIISNNTCYLNGKNGIYFDESYNNNVSNNRFINSTNYGILIATGYQNRFWKNTVENSALYGVYIITGGGIYSIDNIFYKNKFITNNEDVLDGSSGYYTTKRNYWNYSTFGNYWDEYAGVDENDDGIGDTPHDINAIFVESKDFWPIWWDSPQIVINSPSLNDTFEVSPYFNISVVRGIVNCSWYTLNNGITNITFTGLNGTIYKEEWDKRGVGSVLITFYVNDSKGYRNSAEVQVNKNYDTPQISVITPTINQIYGFTAPEFIITISDLSSINSTWYTIDGDLTNYTFSGLTGFINQTAWENVKNGSFMIKFYAKDSLGNVGFNEIELLKDIINPIILINSPTHNQLCGTVAPTFSLMINETNLQVTWYSFNGGDNITFTGETHFDQTEWDKVINGTALITFYAKDKAGNINSSEVIVRKDAYVPIITIHSPLENKAFGNTAPDFNISIIEVDLVSTWYKIEGITTEFSFSELVDSIDQDAWNSIPQGEITITFYAQDRAGNIGTKSVVVIKSIPSQPLIPGYHIFIVIGAISIGLIIIIIRKMKIKN